MNSSSSSIEDDIIDYPDGGFPPIIPCNIFNKIVGHKIKRREYKTKETAVPIKSILEKRRQRLPIF